MGKLLRRACATTSSEGGAAGLEVRNQLPAGPDGPVVIEGQVSE